MQADPVPSPKREAVVYTKGVMQSHVVGGVAADGAHRERCDPAPSFTPSSGDMFAGHAC